MNLFEAVLHQIHHFCSEMGPKDAVPKDGRSRVLAFVDSWKIRHLRVESAWKLRQGTRAVALHGDTWKKFRVLKKGR